MAAFDPATLERWRALAIVDRDGSTVGTISEFYLDRETGHPTWALVNTGLFGTSQSFVPLVHATEISDGLQVPYEKRHIKDSPSVDLHDELTPEEEAALLAHYGVDYEPATGVPAATGAPVATDDGEPVPDEPPGPVAADPTTVVEGEGGSAPADATEALPVQHEPAEAAGGHHHPDPDADTVTAGVPDEPGTTEPDEASWTDQDGVGPEGPTRDGAGSGVQVGSGVERPDGPADPSEVPDGSADPGQIRDGSPDPDSDLNRFRAASADPNRLQDASARLDRDQLHDGPPDPDRDRLQVAPTDPDADRLGDGPADPDLGRTAPVEPGLPGSTAASPYGATATVDKGAAPSGHPADEPLRAPEEPGWAPGAAGSFEEHDPVDPPAGASDRWREAKLAAERDRIARATAALPEERSPLERARRRLERLVGVGQEPTDHDEIPPADREAAERARRARLGIDEEDQRR
jgi:PRC-barrel domain